MSTTSILGWALLTGRRAVLCGCLVGPLLLHPVHAQSDQKKPCDVDRVKREMTEASPSLMAALFSSFDFVSSRCSSVVQVMRLAGSSPKSGGRKLEDDKKFDPKAAAQERAAALADPAFAVALASELAGEIDPVRRLVREAAMLHDSGHYKARDLLIVQLRAGGIK